MTNKKVRTMFLSVVLLLACLVTCLFTFVSPISAYASITINGAYTDVMEDLQVDENFNADDYVVNKDDYSLQVIQVAESVDKELFVYVYQPCTSNGILATSINISTGDNLEYKNYKLKYLNSRSVFYKYLVVGLAVSENETRTYDVSSIFRAWNSDFGDKDAGSGTISEVPYEVAKQYVLSGFGDNIQYYCNDIDVITITDKYVGFVRYEGGYTWDAVTYKSCDNHFVAFSTDHVIDNLLEADVYWETRSYYYKYVQSMVSLNSPVTKYGDIVQHQETLRYDDVEEYQGNIFHKKYKWNKIETVDEFIKGEKHDDVYHVVFLDVRKQTNLTTEGLQDLQGKQFVLRFDTTDYSYKHLNGFMGNTQVSDDITEINSTQVMNVTILRLKFETNGVVYNLGVIDNKQTGDGLPDNYTETSIELNNAFKTFIAVLLFILLLIILWPFLPLIFQFIGWLIKGVWKIICFPFNAIKSIGNKHEQNQDASVQRSKKTGKKVGKNATGKNKK